MTIAIPSVTEDRLGATRLPDGSWEFLVWAPAPKKIQIYLPESKKLYPLDAIEHGYHRAIVPGLAPGTRYFYRIDDDRDLPDPASRFQPEGVHSASALVDTNWFRWTDVSWKGRPLKGSIFYELHVGSYTREGTFDALAARLPELAALGVTTVEVMPIAQFPGVRNWGYDGVYPFAVQNSYGGPLALQRFVDAAHHYGLAVALDVVYNHLGPEGNYLSAFAPYFTDRYRTPWGQAINFDGEASDEVREFFIENALYWLEDCHVDALRLDAVHGIFDLGARHFLAELKFKVADLAARTGRQIQLIAESDLNDSRLLHDPEFGGYGLDGQWSDDFHHSVHTLLTKEDRGYYSDFAGIEPLASTLRNGWFYSGQYSRHRQRRHGNSAENIDPARLVVCSQNHDQVGNRAAGERLGSLVDFESAKLAAGITLLSPFTPLLFMGEEYGETAPFQYFTSHGDPDLVEAVRRGRREEFAAFGWQASVPDPQGEDTFARSHLDHSLKDRGIHKTLYRLYAELIRLRRELGIGSASGHAVRELSSNSLLLTYQTATYPVAAVFVFDSSPVNLRVPELVGAWQVAINSASAAWDGPEKESATSIVFLPDCELRMPPHSFIVLKQDTAPTEAK